jgi:hypothetical protein
LNVGYAKYSFGASLAGSGAPADGLTRTAAIDPTLLPLVGGSSSVAEAAASQ